MVSFIDSNAKFREGETKRLATNLFASDYKFSGVQPRTRIILSTATTFMQGLSFINIPVAATYGQ